MDEQLEFDFLAEKVPSSTTLSELQGSVEAMAKKRKEVAEQKIVLDNLNKELEALENSIKEILEAHNLSKFASDSGTVYVSNRYGVSFPKDPEKAQIFREYLKEQGMEGALTLNHQTLNSFVKTLLQNAEERGQAIAEVLPPGLDAPTVTQTLGFRKGK